ncbi:hypothetical protein [Leuconostoc mesenteroides]|uniref:hypothetical protein n=1 Tax=Leuconostoc mesenteroides TaxID=1245 RepID=UPI002554728F|nr:hypothetical protein [Leuconostoc mesenteroides]
MAITTKGFSAVRSVRLILAIYHLQTENKQTGKAVIIHSWRKANQIRDWFVRRFDLDPNDQLKIAITRVDLEALTGDIEQVLASHALALELLPTASGFFFGSTDYDGYYFEVLRDTRHFLQKEFTYNSDSENLYYTEWW